MFIFTLVLTFSIHVLGARHWIYILEKNTVIRLSDGLVTKATSCKSVNTSSIPRQVTI